ncbi:MAG: glucose-6-phosphate isomerase [Pseudomonadales bacterium]
MTHNFDPSTTQAWKTLQSLAANSADQSISDLFEQDPQRQPKYTLQWQELLLDFSKNRISDEVLTALFDLAKESPLANHIESMFNGERINTTEDRAVLHTALRDPATALQVDSEDLAPKIVNALAKMALVSRQIRNDEWRGSTGKTITDIINIGIGGSDLGPKMICGALAEYAHPALNFHFISNVDGAEILTTLRDLNPETTLVIVSSKTFTTQETLLNTATTLNWFEQTLGLKNAQNSRHFIALTASPENAMRFGIPEDQIIEFWDWVGGRYSLWSSIGLSIAIAVGFDRFQQLLDGANAMDKHFRNAPMEQNLPVILGLIGIWYSNFLDAQSHAVIPYCERLGLLPSYLQQLDMESNGKSVNLAGERIHYNTGPIIWGQTGTNGQHAFFQLLHQGTRLVPMDLIAVVNDPLSNPQHHRILLGNMLAQSAALMSGQQDDNTAEHKVYEGNRPSNVLLMDQLSPYNLGALIALYEHKVFVQGSIWNINCFDQWGVELGKKMANELLGGDGVDGFDPSTEALFKYIEGKS